MTDMELAEEIERILVEYHRAVELDDASLLPKIMSRWCDLFFKPGASAIIAALRRGHEPTREAAHQMRQTISHAVARGWGAPANSHKGMDTALAAAIVDEVICAIKASPEHPPSGEIRELERIAAELKRERLLSLAASVRDVALNLSAAEAEGRKS